MPKIKGLRGDFLNIQRIHKNRALEMAFNRNVGVSIIRLIIKNDMEYETADTKRGVVYFMGSSKFNQWDNVLDYMKSEVR